LTHLKRQYGSQVFGPIYDSHRISDMDVKLSEGDEFTFGESNVQVLFLPGHTLGHIAYYMPRQRWLFCGDVLFSVGCGRLFEGTPEQLMNSLRRISALLDETQIFCAHEYTEKNAQFALSLDPENEALKKYIMQIQNLREAHQPTVPFQLGLQKKINPFLRPDCGRIRRRLGLELSTDIEVLARLRELRNHW
jgi:hydroxyacylglutathione hydrolase